MTTPELLSLCERVAGLAEGGEQVEAFASRSTSTSVKVAKGEVESFTSAQNEGMGIRVVRDGRQGLAWCTVLDEASLRETLAEARDNAAYGSVDEFAGLAEPDGVAPVESLDLWRDGFAGASAADKVAFAMEVERLTMAGDPRIRGIRQCAYGDAAGESAMASTTGVRSHTRRTTASCSVMALGDDDGDTQTGAGFDVGRELSDLDAKRIADEAVAYTTRMMGARKPGSATVTLVLDPQETPTIIGLLASLANGENVLKQRSIWANRIGEQVASPLVQLVDDPTNPDAMGSSPYDGEGLASRRNVIVEGGVLQGYLYNAQIARRAGATTTGTAVRGGFGGAPGIGARSPYLAPGDQSPEEIIAGIELGILVDSIMGAHSGISLVSGDVSVGVSGLMIRNGQLAEPVKECVVASTIQRMLLDVRAVGNDLEWRGGGPAGCTLAIDGVRLAGA